MFSWMGNKTEREREREINAWLSGTDIGEITESTDTIGNKYFALKLSKLLPPLLFSLKLLSF